MKKVLHNENIYIDYIGGSKLISGYQRVWFGALQDKTKFICNQRKEKFTLFTN